MSLHSLSQTREAKEGKSIRNEVRMAMASMCLDLAKVYLREAFRMADEADNVPLCKHLHLTLLSVEDAGDLSA